MNLAQVLEWKYGPVAGTASIISVSFESIDYMLTIPFDKIPDGDDIEITGNILKTIVLNINNTTFKIASTDILKLDLMGNKFVIKKSIADSYKIPYDDSLEDKENTIFTMLAVDYIVPNEEFFNLNKTSKTLKIKQIEADSYKIPYNGDDIEMVIDKWNHSDKQPTKAQIEKDFVEYEKHLKAIAYKEKRRAEYPPVEDQLDALWKGGADAENMKSQIEAVKTKHPKP